MDVGMVVGGCLFKGQVRRCGVSMVNDLCLLTLSAYAKGLRYLVCVCVCVTSLHTLLKAFIRDGYIDWLFTKIRFSKIQISLKPFLSQVRTLFPHLKRFGFYYPRVNSTCAYQVCMCH